MSAPLTPAVFHVLLALAAGARHGYAVMQDVRVHTNGKLRMGPGTLYGTIDRLIAARWVDEVDAEEPSQHDARRRYYALTREGRRALDAEIERLEEAVRAARTLRPVSRRSRS
jgi:DNA-binding PadR family transcriptional regulator